MLVFKKFQQQHQRNQMVSRQKYQNHKKICQNSKISVNFNNRWNFLKHYQSNLTQNLQIDSHGLTEFFWDIVKDSTKYSKNSIKKLVNLINDIKIPNPKQFHRSQPDVEMKSEDMEEEKQSQPQSSV